MAIPTVPISMRLGEYSKQYIRSSKCNWFAKFFLRHFSAISRSLYTFPEAAVSPIRMKLAVKDSLYLFSPMKVVAFRYLVCTRLDKCLKHGILWP